MATRTRVIQIGNSKGVRLPKRLLERYGIGDALLMEETPDAIILRPESGQGAQLSWEATYREMAEASEDWSDWSEIDIDTDA